MRAKKHFKQLGGFNQNYYGNNLSKWQVGGTPMMSQDQPQEQSQQSIGITPEQENQIISAFLQTVPKEKQKAIIEQLMKLKKENPQAYQQALMQMAQSLNQMNQNYSEQQGEEMEEAPISKFKMGGFNLSLRKLKKGGMKKGYKSC